jgi:hypothetical protein
MQTPIQDTQRTRWDKLCEFVKRLLKFCVIFNPDGIDIYFLNRRKFPKVKDPAVVDQIFQRLPIGYTPLVPVLKEIFESEMAGDKKLLVFVATDGGPTDKDANLNVHELERLQWRIQKISEGVAIMEKKRFSRQYNPYFFIFVKEK